MPTPAAARTSDVDAFVRALEQTRERTLALVAHLDDATLERVHSPLMSPLVWDLGHIAAFEDLWAVRGFAGRPLLREDLADVYDAFETPRADRGELPFLRRAGALDYLAAVRERTLAAIAQRGIDPTLHELVLRHEQQHGETMLQTMELAHLPAPGDGLAAPLPPDPDRPAPGDGGLDLVEVAAGPATLGAAAIADGGRFSYDNERPRHAVELPAFRIGRTPITNASFLAFVEGGGYARREWWSREAWAWKEEHDIVRPAGWTADGREWRMDRQLPLDPDKPVVHVSWFEADAFARAHGARLPTEAEWEKAATWDHATGTARRQPWGEGDAHGRANVDWRRYGTTPVGVYADGVAPSGCLGMVGDVWEWTASDFRGYPGFVAEPYKEYSEVFFGPDYRVLRGGSWATRARVATATFRNWDYPHRRQIFAGFRIAMDGAHERPRAPRARGAGVRPGVAGEPVVIDRHLDAAHERGLADDVLDGLTRPFKELPPKHFYDALGCELFDRICELPEYYPTRTERALLEAEASAIVERTGAVELVELGSGSAEKTRVLLDAMAAAGTLRRYVPLDVAETAVQASAEALVEEYPGMRVHGVIGDFERHLDRIPPPIPGEPRIVALLGGTIGNFPPGSRRRLLRRIGELLGPDDHLLLGTGLVTDTSTLEAAYDDAAGVTAEFNRNVLRVVNRELDADFPLDGFDHIAFFDRRNEWIEMRLRALRPCSVLIGALDLRIELAAGEEIRTEISAKFTHARLREDFEAAGLRLTAWHTDADERHALSLAAPAVPVAD